MNILEYIVNNPDTRQEIKKIYIQSNRFITSGIVSISHEPMADVKGVVHVQRVQQWTTERLTAIGQDLVVGHIGQYVSRCLTRSFLSILSAATTVDEELTLENTVHPLALVHSVRYGKLHRDLELEYTRCPFTSDPIPFYQGKRLVPDDMCPTRQTVFLTYPGEILIHFPEPPYEVQLHPDDNSVLMHRWDYDILVRGFEWQGALRPDNNVLGDKASWLQVGPSRIQRISQEIK